MRQEIVLGTDWNNPHSARRRNAKKHKSAFTPRRSYRLGAQWVRSVMTNQIVKQTACDEGNQLPSSLSVPGSGTVVLSPQLGLQPCHSAHRCRQQNQRIRRQPPLAMGWSAQKRWQCRSIS